MSRLEVDREGPSYTSDTLRALRESRPDDELFLILGGDQAAALPAWHEPEEVLALATVAVVERVELVAQRDRDQGGPAEGRARDPLPRHAADPDLLERDPPPVAAGQPIRYLVPDTVAAYVEEHGLYGASAASRSGAPA